MKIAQTVLAILFCSTSLTVFSQDSLEVDSFIIVKEFVPTLSQASKIRINPEIKDTQNIEVNTNYNFLDKQLSHDFEPEIIKAAILKGEPLVKLRNNYLILGYGNNATPIAEFYYNQLRSKNSSIGVYGRHLSSSGIHDIENSGYSNNAVGLSGSRYSRKFTFSGKVDYRYDAVNYYGYNPDLPGINLDNAAKNENISQFFQRIGGEVSFSNNQRDTSGVRHYSELSYHYLSDRYNTNESRFVASQELSLIHSKEILTFDWELDYNKLSDEASGSLTNYSKENTILYAEPGIELRGSKWVLEGGLKFALEFDVNTNPFLYPIVDFRYNLIKSIIVPYAGLKGGLERNSFHSFTDDNAFVSSAVELRNSDKKYVGYAGIRGNLSKNTSFNLSFSQSKINDMPLYVKDSNSVEERNFSVLYDEVDLTELGAELIYEPIEKWRFVLNGKYFIYSASRELYAWHKPDYRISALTTYKLGSKIKADLLVYLIGSQKARTSDTALVQTYKTLEGTVDLNLNLEYRYSKKINVFLDLNNLAAIKYEKWQDYPTQGFSVLGGFKFSF